MNEAWFPKVAEVFYISNLMIEIKIRTQFLSPGVNYKVTIDKVEKVEEVQAIDNASLNITLALGNSMQVMKHEDIEQIEEVQFTDIASFKSSHSKKICLHVNHVEIGLKKVQQFLISNSKRDKLKSMLSEMNRKKQDMVIEVKDHIIRKVNAKVDHREVLMAFFHEEFIYHLQPNPSTSRFETGIVNTNEHHMLSAKEFLYNTSIVKLLRLKPSVQSRFQEVVELRSQQVLHIKCRIKFQMSPNTEYACYLVFKLSERCCGLHCPVIVRDLLHWKKDTGILYFRSPSPRNLHDTNWVPEKVESWMDGGLCYGNLKLDFELRIGSCPMNLKIPTKGNRSNKPLISILTWRDASLSSCKVSWVARPVIVRDLLQWEKDTGILYFRSPSPWNLHGMNWIPKEREDGGMEVNVWKFHSDFEFL
ncbi:serine/threonine-protein kinase, active site protein [Tanacetum coccineum]